MLLPNTPAGVSLLMGAALAWSLMVGGAFAAVPTEPIVEALSRVEPSGEDLGSAWELLLPQGGGQRGTVPPGRALPAGKHAATATKPAPRAGRPAAVAGRPAPKAGRPAARAGKPAARASAPARPKPKAARVAARPIALAALSARVQALAGRQGMKLPSRGAITSGFGPRRLGSHHGVDLRAPVGTPVKAAQSGVVTVAGWYNGIYGNMVAISHGNGLVTRYAHNSRVLVSPGQQVRQGDVVALSGNTGRTTGPHIHFEVLKDGRAIDPMRMAR